MTSLTDAQITKALASETLNGTYFTANDLADTVTRLRDRNRCIDLECNKFAEALVQQNRNILGGNRRG